MNSYSSKWTYLPIFLPQDFLRDNLIGTITYFTRWNARYDWKSPLWSDTSRESQKTGGVSSNHSSYTNISKVPSHLFYFSRFCRPLVRCGKLSSWYYSGKSWSLLSPSHFQPILRGTIFVPSCIEFILPSVHPPTQSFLPRFILYFPSRNTRSLWVSELIGLDIVN